MYQWYRMAGWTAGPEWSKRQHEPKKKIIHPFLKVITVTTPVISPYSFTVAAWSPVDTSLTV